MLENFIARTFRKARNKRRERVARRFDDIADHQGALKRFYASALAAGTLLGAPSANLDDIRDSYRKHKKAEAQARQLAADVRAGRR
jgi:hypothetical protein